MDLKAFMRSRTWIASPFGDAAMLQLGLDPKATHCEQALILDPLSSFFLTSVRTHAYTHRDTVSKEKQEELANNPDTYFKMRKVIEDGGNLIHDSTLRGTKMQQQFQAFFEAGMRERLSKKPELFEAIVPKFAPGCRRLTPGVGYLEALMEDNVEVITDKIESVTETGVKLASGREVALDVLVCATGYKVSEPPPFEVVGRDGRTLADRWSPVPESYLSMAVDGFPNYLMMFGPNSAIGFGSLTKILETEGDYIVKVIRKLQKDDYASIEPRPERVAGFQEFVGAYFKDTVYMDDCKSWYRTEGGTGDWICGLWPGSTLHALEALRAPRWEDFVYESLDPSPHGMAWLGNGWSTTQTDGDPSWYINPDEVEIPLEGKPEENPKYKVRPWSH